MRNSTRIANLSLAAVLFAGAPARAAEACKQPGTATANIALVKKFYAAFNTKDKSLLDSVLIPDWVDIPLAPGQRPGREGMKGAMDGYWAAFPDMNVTNEDFVAQGNKVAVRSMVKGTHKGVFAGVKASGKPVSVLAIDIHEICGGMIQRTWHAEDWLSGLFQMGAMPPK